MVWIISVFAILERLVINSYFGYHLHLQGLFILCISPVAHTGTAEGDVILLWTLDGFSLCVLVLWHFVNLRIYWRGMSFSAYGLLQLNNINADTTFALFRVFLPIDVYSALLKNIVST